MYQNTSLYYLILSILYYVSCDNNQPEIFLIQNQLNNQVLQADPSTNQVFLNVLETNIVSKHQLWRYNGNVGAVQNMETEKFLTFTEQKYLAMEDYHASGGQYWYTLESGQITCKTCENQTLDFWENGQSTGSVLALSPALNSVKKQWSWIVVSLVNPNGEPVQVTKMAAEEEEEIPFLSQESFDSEEEQESAEEVLLIDENSTFSINPSTAGIVIYLSNFVVFVSLASFVLCCAAVCLLILIIHMRCKKRKYSAIPTHSDDEESLPLKSSQQ